MRAGVLPNLKGEELPWRRGKSTAKVTTRVPERSENPRVRVKRQKRVMNWQKREKPKASDAIWPVHSRCNLDVGGGGQERWDVVAAENWGVKGEEEDRRQPKNSMGKKIMEKREEAGI